MTHVAQADKKLFLAPDLSLKQKTELQTALMSDVETNKLVNKILHTSKTAFNKMQTHCAIINKKHTKDQDKKASIEYIALNIVTAFNTFLQLISQEETYQSQVENGTITVRKILGNMFDYVKKAGYDRYKQGGKVRPIDPIYSDAPKLYLQCMKFLSEIDQGIGESLQSYIKLCHLLIDWHAGKDCNGALVQDYLYNFAVISYYENHNITSYISDEVVEAREGLNQTLDMRRKSLLDEIHSKFK